MHKERARIAKDIHDDLGADLTQIALLGELAALDYLRLAGIRCRLDFPESTPARELSTDVRHNLFLAIKEALNNIVKHAHATEVWLRVSATDDGLQIRVEDNGCGFDQPPQDAGADGLRNMRQRMAEIGGECRIESKTGAGTQISFELPWPRQ